MKITFLGTGAIGFPLAFCNCENCKLAREHKGKSLRKRASLLINNELIIDLGSDTQTSMRMYDKDMRKVKYLLQTHIHIDHFDEGALITRIPYIAIKNHLKLEILAHPTNIQIMSERISRYEQADLITKKGQETLNVHSNSINAGETIQFGKYQIKTIETTHDLKHGALLYVVCYNQKSVLYATDTPPLTEEALKQLSEFCLDTVIMDHTFGDTEYSCAHLNISLFKEQLNKLSQLGIINEHTQIYDTHISHDGLTYHEKIEENAIQNGYHIAYDGLEINL